MTRGGKNFIPRPDGDFSAWAANLSTAAAAFWEAHGLEKPLLETLQAALAEWETAYPAHLAAQAAAAAATQAKERCRLDLEAAARPLVNFVQSYTATTNADRAAMGITVRDGARTPAPTPVTSPSASVDVNARLTHTLRLVNGGPSSGPPGRAAGAGGSRRRGGKPEGVVGAEVWVKVVEAGAPVPTDPAALNYLTLTTRSVVRASFKSADGGKTAVYMLRWVNSRGEKGPWSEVVSATVAA